MPRINPININCIGCNKEHLTLRPTVTRYCSVKCARKYQIMKPHSDETKKRIKETNLKTYSRPELRSRFQGKNHPLWGKSSNHCGKDHWNWKGGISSKDRLERMRFRQQIQKKVFDRDNYTCQICGDQGIDLQVDHIQSWAEYVELRFNINNCRTLCMKCHYKITYGKPMPPEVRAWGHNLKGGKQL